MLDPTADSGQSLETATLTSSITPCAAECSVTCKELEELGLDPDTAHASMLTRKHARVFSRRKFSITN